MVYTGCRSSYIKRATSVRLALYQLFPLPSDVQGLTHPFRPPGGQAVMRMTTEKQATDAAEFAAKLKSVIAAGQAGADQLADASKLKM